MKSKGSILVIDDDKDVLYTAKLILKSHFEKVDTEDSPHRLIRLIEDNRYDVVLLDMNFKAGATSGNEGLFWLREILKTDPECHVVLNTVYGDIDIAVEGMKAGATDFITKPWPHEKLLATVENAFKMSHSAKKVKKLTRENQALNDDLSQPFSQIISKSPEIEKVLGTVDKVAPTDASVLILGENGTGKELIARAIHKRSDRSEKPFIKVDIGALPENLIESELFGHTRGAFTDAREDREGRFEIADGGTLFLDEIGNLSPKSQMKLLTALQAGEIQKVGSDKTKPVDIRLITATNLSLEEGNFRQDLLYRINTVEIFIPPLRKRKEDIPLLIEHFVSQFSGKYGKEIYGLTVPTLEELMNYHWPGNVRELQHAVERAIIMSQRSRLDTEDFMLKKMGSASGSDSLKVAEVEKDAIRKAVEQHKGNLSKAAKTLGIGRSTLYRKLKKHGLS